MRKHILIILLLSLGLISLFARCNFKVKGTSPLLSPSELPTPSLAAPSTDCSPPDTYGAVKGRLFLTNGQPSVGSILYLGEYVGLETSSPVVVLDPSRHLHTQTGEGGSFCFSEVPPGKYGLIVWDAVESILLPDPTTGYSLLLEIKSGETADVGVLYSPIP